MFLHLRLDYSSMSQPVNTQHTQLCIRLCHSDSDGAQRTRTAVHDAACDARVLAHTGMHLTEPTE